MALYHLVLSFFMIVTASCVLFPGAEKAQKVKHDNTWCFKGVYDYDNCPEKDTLLACVKCCSELRTYYERPPSKNVCLAACADRFPKLGIEWIYP